MMRHLLGTLLAAVVMAASGPDSSSRAVEMGDEIPLSLHPGMPPDGAWVPVERELRQGSHIIGNLHSDGLEDTLYQMIERGEARTRVEAFAQLLRREIYWGPVDLDGDRIAEMLVWPGIPGFCGTAGCPSLVLQRQAAGWIIVGGLHLEAPTHNLCYTGAGPDGGPMIRSERIALWWSGSDFSSICYRACEGWGDPDAISEEELGAATKRELEVRDMVRQRPWCEADIAN